MIKVQTKKGLKFIVIAALTLWVGFQGGAWMSVGFLAFMILGGAIIPQITRTSTIILFLYSLVLAAGWVWGVTDGPYGMSQGYAALYVILAVIAMNSAMAAIRTRPPQATRTKNRSA